MDKMEVPDDLLTVISLYATERVLYQLFGFDRSLSRSLFTRYAFWRAKVEYETRGLVVNDDAIRGHWRDYYRIVNRTYYGVGHLISFTRNGREINTRLLHQFNSVTLGYASSGQYFFQGADSNLEVSGQRIPYSRPIRRVVIDVLESRLIAVDERGFVVTTQLGSASWVTPPVPENVVDIALFASWGGDWVGLLTRDGTVINYDSGKQIEGLISELGTSLLVVQLDSRWDGTILDSNGMIYRVASWIPTRNRVLVKPLWLPRLVSIPTGINLFTHTSGDPYDGRAGISGLDNQTISIFPVSPAYWDNYVILGIDRKLRTETYDNNNRPRQAVVLPGHRVQSISGFVELALIVDSS